MKIQEDPRTNGFNYGSTFEPHINPPIYIKATAIAIELGKEASRLSAQSWELEMALRDVRHSCSKEEKERATVRLEAKATPYLNRVPA